jgi:CHAD domain-containing protein
MEDRGRSAAAVEREVKLGAPTEFRLPALNDLVPEGGLRSGTPLLLEAVYFDAPDLRLARSGITLRHRTEGDTAVWTLKLPRPADATSKALARLEIDVVDPPGSLGPLGPPPVVLVDQIASRLRTAPLTPVVRLRTARRSIALLDASGAVVAEVVDDDVTVLEGDEVRDHFREVEVELGPGGDGNALDRVVDRLVGAGAGEPDPTPKAVRALGPRASVPPELAERPVPAAPSGADVVLAGIRRAVVRLVEHDPIIREGDDIEGVHQARVATRRLRSDLRAFHSLIDATWVDSIRDELGWLGGALGEVRDADVLLLRLRRQLDGLDAVDWPPALELLERLRIQRLDAVAALESLLHGDRYLVLLDRLVAAAEGDVPFTARAARPADDLVPGLARAPYEKLAKAVHRLGPSPADAELHRLRIRAKQARYAAELAVGAVGKPAQKLADRLGALQDVLGEHQDACVARSWLRAVAVGESPEVALAAGQLMEIERTEALEHRLAWPTAWEAVRKEAQKENLRAWLS